MYRKFVKFGRVVLGRLFDRVDLIKPVSNVRPSIRPSVRPSVHKKFLRFQPGILEEGHCFVYAGSLMPVP